MIKTSLLVAAVAVLTATVAAPANAQGQYQCKHFCGWRVPNSPWTPSAPGGQGTRSPPQVPQVYQAPRNYQQVPPTYKPRPLNIR
jgi:hypothetical protein